MLRLGIIGCGRVTTMFHLGAIKRSGVVELVGVSDKGEEQLREVATAAHIPYAYADYSELLACSEVEAIAINTPPRLHEEMTLAALAAGKHVLCEKPLAQKVEGCLGIKNAKGNLVVLPAHNYAYTPALYRIEERIAEGAIGEVTSASLSFQNNLSMYGSKTDFRTTDPRGIVEDVLPHIFSVASKVAGPPAKVESVYGSCSKYEVCDNLTARVVTDRGIPVNCTASWTKTIPEFGVTITGERGTITSNFAMNPYGYALEADGKKTKVSGRGVSWYLDLVRFRHPSFSEQYRHLERLVREGGEPRVSIDEEVAMLRVMGEIGKTAEEVSGNHG